jgi:hypothetical protein
MRLHIVIFYCHIRPSIDTHTKKDRLWCNLLVCLVESQKKQSFLNLQVINFFVILIAWYPTLLILGKAVWSYFGSGFPQKILQASTSNVGQSGIESLCMDQKVESSRFFVQRGAVFFFHIKRLSLDYLKDVSRSPLLKYTTVNSRLTPRTRSCLEKYLWSTQWGLIQKNDRASQ